MSGDVRSPKFRRRTWTSASRLECGCDGGADGGDHGRAHRANGAIRRPQRPTQAGKDVDEKTKRTAEKARAFLKKWYAEHVIVEGDYLQTRLTGGPPVEQGGRLVSPPLPPGGQLGQAPPGGGEDRAPQGRAVPPAWASS